MRLAWFPYCEDCFLGFWSCSCWNITVHSCVLINNLTLCIFFWLYTFNSKWGKKRKSLFLKHKHCHSLSCKEETEESWIERKRGRGAYVCLKFLQFESLVSIKSPFSVHIVAALWAFYTGSSVSLIMFMW